MTKPRFDSPAERALYDALEPRLEPLTDMAQRFVCNDARVYVFSHVIGAWPERKSRAWWSDVPVPNIVFLNQVTVPERCSESARRLDFAMVCFDRTRAKERPTSWHARVAVEVDGWAYHGQKQEQFASDRQRDRQLFDAGWTTIRFAAGDVLRNPQAVADELLGIASRTGGWW